MDFRALGDLIVVLESVTGGHLTVSDYFDRFKQRLPVRCHGHHNAFCGHVKSGGANPQSCNRFENRFIACAVKERWERGCTDPFCKRCYAGVVEICMPLVVADELVGRLALGPYRWPRAREVRDMVCDRERAVRGTVHAAVREALPRLDAQAQQRNALLLAAFGAALEQAIAALGPGDRGALTRRGVVLEFLQKNYFRRVELRDLAVRLHLSTSRAGVVVQEMFGLPFTRLLQGVRLEKSCELLACTDVPVGEVARMCGFPNPNYLFRLFKREYGQTPERWRRQQAGAVAV